jgi:hypothetical protein
MPFDADLADRLRGVVKRRKGLSEKRMFGGICWMLRGNMLCGVEVGRYMFRVGPALEAEALSRPGARPMDITGRPMRGFVWVDARAAPEPELRRWVDLATRFVGKLPPK